MTSDQATQDETLRGQAVYTPFTLRLYDAFVLGLSNRWIWRCPTRELRRHYENHLSANHLEVGVGTGYFLDRCPFPSKPRLTLLDLNPHCLETAGRRVSRYEPRRWLADVFQLASEPIEPYDSIGLNYVLHCLPGDMSDKAAAVENLERLLRPGGVLFGSTLLGRGVRSNLFAKGLMRIYNRKGIFSNRGDSREALCTLLASRFENVQTRTVGCALLFAARKAPGPQPIASD